MNKFATENEKFSEEFDISFNALASLEGQARKGILVKPMYVHICDDDLVSGILLAQIVYWFSEDANGNQRTRMIHENRSCIVKQRSEWFEEICISPKQYDRAIGFLKEKGFVDVEIHKSHFHNHDTAAFIFINKHVLIKEIKRYWQDRKKPEQGGNPEFTKGEFTPIRKVNPGITERVIPIYTENITENISENKNTYAPPGGDAQSSISSKSLKKKEEEKIERRHNIQTTDDEHKKLVSKYGNEFTDLCYDQLSEWKESAPPSQVKKHSSDYLRITKWVAIDLKERQLKEKKLDQSLNSPNNQKSEDNKKLAIKILNAYTSSSYADVTIAPTGVAFTTKGYSSKEIILEYSTPGFESQLMSLIEKYKFPKNTK